MCIRDSININKIKKADLRRSLGVVLQDTNLFTGTVMDNIRYGRLDACDEAVSYKHLDVYKRQGEKPGGHLGGAAFGP